LHAHFYYHDDLDNLDLDLDNLYLYHLHLDNLDLDNSRTRSM
jgi:hypothetical protein